MVDFRLQAGEAVGVGLGLAAPDEQRRGGLQRDGQGDGRPLPALPAQAARVASAMNAYGRLEQTLCVVLSRLPPAAFFYCGLTWG